MVTSAQNLQQSLACTGRMAASFGTGDTPSSEKIFLQKTSATN